MTDSDGVVNYIFTNIFALNFKLSTKNTLAGGQLGGLFRDQRLMHGPESTIILLTFIRSSVHPTLTSEIRIVNLLPNALAARVIVSRETETFVGSSSRSSCERLV